MTDIRKHGFESDAQWREYLQEIEEAERPDNIQSVGDENILHDLAVLRTEIAALRELVKIRHHRGQMMRWTRVMGAAVLLLLVATVGR